MNADSGILFMSVDSDTRLRPWTKTCLCGEMITVCPRPRVQSKANNSCMLFLHSGTNNVHSPPLPPRQIHTLSLPHTHTLSLSLSLFSQSLLLSLSVSVFVTVSVSHTHTLSLSLSVVSHCLCLCLSVCLSLSLCITLFLSVSVSLSLSLPPPLLYAFRSTSPFSPREPSIKHLSVYVNANGSCIVSAKVHHVKSRSVEGTYIHTLSTRVQKAVNSKKQQESSRTSMT